MSPDIPSNALTTHPVTRLVWGPVPSPRFPERAPHALNARRILVLGGDRDTAQKVVDDLVAAGAVVRAIDSTQTSAAVSQVVDELGRVDAIVDLNVVNIAAEFSLAEGAAWERPLAQTVDVLRRCYGAWLDESSAQRLGYLVVTQMDGKMGYGHAGSVQPLGGLWAGLAKTLPQEILNCHIKVVDLARSDFSNVGPIVARELSRWGLFEIGWADGVRYYLGARAEPVVVDLPELTAEDTVLLSGGGRGIGFKLAVYLAATCGCRVVISGREELPGEGEPAAAMTADEFRQYEWDQMKRAAQTQTVGAVRKALNRERKRRELAENMRMAAENGLRIDYRSCDVTSAAQVDALVAAYASALTVVIHNAGVDTPARLPSKPNESVLQTVRTKVGGFINLFRAVQHMKLRLFCNVGSLTGRWGGMTGETDYAAANECLTRLGLWANGRAGFPVKTIVWPTWDRVGMIKNFDVTAAYMSPLDVDEGVRHWHQELRSSAPAEMAYIGTVGTALTPIQIEGFPAVDGMPGIDLLYSRLHYLGEVVTFVPSRSMRSDCAVGADVAPLLDDFRVDGKRAMPVSVLLDYAIFGGSWVQPANRRQMYLHEIRDLECSLRCLIAENEGYFFSRDVTAKEIDGVWTVEVAMTGAAGVALRATLVYRAEPRPSGSQVVVPRASRTSSRSSADLQWRGMVFETADWGVTEEGTWVASIRPGSASDKWATVVAPTSELPAAHIENAIRASAALNDGGQRRSARLRIGRMQLFESSTARFVVGHPGERWEILDDEGRAALEMTGLRFEQDIEIEQGSSA